MIRIPQLIVASLTALAGCTSPSTPQVSKPLPRPPIEVSHEARQVLQQIVSDQKLGDNWWLRFDLMWRPNSQIEIHIVRTPPTESDFVYDADGIRCAMPKELTTYLKNIRVEWIDEQPKGRFSVSFDNETPAEFEAGRQWLQEQAQRRREAMDKAKSSAK